MTLTLVAAVAANGVVGLNNGLPWSMPEDLKHFKNLTQDSIIVMGRKTFDSLGGILPRRHHLVITSTQREPQRAVTFISDGVAALKELHKRPMEYFLIGGPTLWKQALDAGLVDAMVISHISESFEGDSYFPTVDWTSWKAEPVQTYDGFSVVRYSI